MYKLICILVFTGVFFHEAYSQAETPDFYNVSYSEKKLVFSPDFKDTEFKKVLEENNDHAITVNNGIITLNLMTDSGLVWGANKLNLDSAESWEIETVVKPEKARDFYMRFSGKANDTTYNIVYILNNKRQATVGAVQGEKKYIIIKNNFDMYEWLSKDTCFTITIRKTKYKMELFIDYRYVGSFPKESLKINGDAFYWGLNGKSTLHLYSLKVYKISPDYNNDFIANYSAARLDGINNSQKKEILNDNFNDNTNQWKEVEWMIGYTGYSDANISGGYLKSNKKNVVKTGVMDFNEDFELETVISSGKDFGTIRIGTDSTGLTGGIELGLWADRRYSNSNPPRYLQFKFDSFYKYESGYYAFQKDQIKFLLRKVGDVLYVFADDKFITAMNPCRKMYKSICFTGPGKYDYVKVSKILSPLTQK